jgi:fructose-bisphosphate aldolase class II
VRANEQGADKPNKKFYDPRNWMRKSEEAAVARLGEAFADLNSVGVLA